MKSTMNQSYDSCEIHKIFLICAIMISPIEHLCKREFKRFLYTCSIWVLTAKKESSMPKISFQTQMIPKILSSQAELAAVHHAGRKSLVEFRLMADQKNTSFICF